MFDPQRPGPDYALRWPPELFAREANALLARYPGSRSRLNDVPWLLEEAFVADQPGTAFADVGTWSSSGPAAQEQFLRKLINAARRFEHDRAPRPYFADRQVPTDPSLTSGAPDLAGARQNWALAVQQLEQQGYLERVAPKPCVDDDTDQTDPGEALATAVADRIGALPIGQYWPLSPDSWDDDTFFSLVEVFHDLVARPRQRTYHPYDNCGWHYSDFAVEPAQILYRWTINRILTRHGIDLQLAKSGEDVGRLIRTPSDSRSALLSSVTAGATASNRDEVDHAIALFRARGATAESKRSACVTLIGVLENRRDVVKSELLSKDEGALFEIANKFAIRHRKADQRSGYDEVYLDWLFWWYLATVELINRLIVRAHEPSGDCPDPQTGRAENPA